jgi:hypothetical protein
MDHMGKQTSKFGDEFKDKEQLNFEYNLLAF